MTDNGRSSLEAVSPLDGRYARYTEALVPYVSERALIEARVRVEVEYLLALSGIEALDIDLTTEQRGTLEAISEDFSLANAKEVKRIEVEGTDERAATNHDVKAVEYFLRDRIDPDLWPWIHFGLTSEDVNNLAYRLLVAGAFEAVLLPELEELEKALAAIAREHRNTPMLARTHGQPATPTTFGKEMAVYASRFGSARKRIERAVEGLHGKLAGASGTYAAHTVAAPDVDWPAFAEAFVEELGLSHLSLATQVNPADDLAALFDALAGANAVCIDLDRDAWLYISQGYLGQRGSEGETGSSTMPHKVNPIDFENSEGNCEKATSDLRFLSNTLTTSRLQRDLSDSTVKRTMGTAFAHSLIGYEKLGTGLSKIVPNETRMAADLESHPEVLGEAIQTVLRREGHADAYERLKETTRGRAVSRGVLETVIDDPELDLSADARERLRALAPEAYIGLASDLVEESN